MKIEVEPKVVWSVISELRQRAFNLRRDGIEAEADRVDELAEVIGKAVDTALVEAVQSGTKEKPPATPAAFNELKETELRGDESTEVGDR